MICCVTNCLWRKSGKYCKPSEDVLDCVYIGCPYRAGSKIIEPDGTEIEVETRSKGINYEDEMRKDMKRLNKLAAEIFDITDTWTS